jgi:hypothetical protein
MHKKGLSGLGVTQEPGGPLLANLSLSDLRGLTPDRFGALALPLGSFLLLQKGHGLSWQDCLTERLPEAVTVGAAPGLPSDGISLPLEPPESSQKICITVIPNDASVVPAGGTVGRGARRH